MAILTEPTVIRDDDLDGGVLLYLYFGGASPTDRLFIYRYDDDAPLLTVGPDLIAIGIGSAYTDKYIYANTGDPYPPALRYNVSSAQWEYSNNGVDFLPIGSGGGGGGSGPHTLLSSTHTDTQGGAVQLGDIIVGNATPRWSRLPGNTTTTKKFLTQTGTGVISAVPMWDVIDETDLPPHTHDVSDILNFEHASSHLAGGSDELTGNLNAVARVGVRKNSGTTTYTRRRLNLIEGSNISITVADDAGNEEVDITISSSTASHASSHLAGGPDELIGNLNAVARVGVRKNSGTTTYTRRRLNLIEGSNISITVADDSGNEEVDITISGSTASHASSHLAGGSDELTGNLNAVARVGARINSGGPTYQRRRLNFIAGTGMTLSIADDAVNEEVDITIGASSIRSLPYADISSYRVPSPDYYYTSALFTYTATTLAGSANRLEAIPFVVPRRTTIGTMHAFVSTAATGNIKLAIYADNGDYSYPGALVAGSSDISTSTTGLKTWNANVTLDPGLYWLAIHFSAAPTMRALPASAVINLLGWANDLSSLKALSWRATSTYTNGLPSTFPSGATANTSTVYALFVTISGYPEDDFEYAPADAAYVVLANDATLTDERVLDVGDSLTLTDGGAGGNVTIDTIQGIRPTDSPTFAGITLTGLTGVLVSEGASGVGAVAAVSGNTYLRRNANNDDYEFGAISPLHLVPETGNGNALLGVSSDSLSVEYKRLVGTANQVTVTYDEDTITLGTPQDLDTSASVQFGSLALSDGLSLGFASGGVLAVGASGDVYAISGTAGQVLRVSSGGVYEFADLVYPSHASSHEAGGSDPITGNLNANARVGVRINTGTTTYRRRRLNLLAGSNISLAMSDDPANEEVRVTISAGNISGAPGTAAYVVWEKTPALTGSRYLIDGVNTTVTIDDEEGTIAIDTVPSPTFTGLALSGLTAGSVLFAGADGVISQNNANFFWDNTNKRLGIGTNTPEYTLAVLNDGTTANDQILGLYTRMGQSGANNTFLIVENFLNAGAAGNCGSFVNVRHARGTRSSPSGVQASDRLGGVLIGGYTGSDWVSGAAIIGFASENWTTTSAPTYIAFETAPSGSVSRVERARITAGGNLQVGGTTSTEFRVYTYYGVTNPYVTTGALYAVVQPTINTVSSAQAYNLIVTHVMGTANSVAAHYGCLLYAYSNNTATVTTLAGAQTWVRNLGTGTITNAIGLMVANPSNSGTITTNYGIYLESMSAGNTNYGIYIAGSNQWAIYAAGGATYLGGTLRVASTVTFDALTGVLISAGSSGVSAVAATGASQYLRRNAANSAYEFAALTASDLPSHTHTRSQITDFAHASTHASGGADALTGNLDAIARTSVRVNSGASTYSRRRLNFIPGVSMSISHSDDSVDEEVDITINTIQNIRTTDSPTFAGITLTGLTGVLISAGSSGVSALAATGASQYLRRNAANNAYEFAALTASDLPSHTHTRSQITDFAHASTHASGGADALTGNLDAVARVGVRVNSGGSTYQRRRLNFIPGTGITISIADDATDEEVDVTISSSGGGGAPVDASYVVLSSNATLTAERVLTAGASISITDGGANGTVTINTIQNIRTTDSPTFAGLTLSGLTAGSVLFASTGGAISQDNANLYWDNSNKRIGIGTNAPGYRVTIYDDGTSADSQFPLLISRMAQSGANNTIVLVENFLNAGSAGNCGAFVRTAHARGTRSSPTAVQANDRLGGLLIGGHTGSGWVSSGAIVGFAAENWTTSSTPVYITFETAASGSTTRLERARITPGGNFQVGGTTGSEFRIYTYYGITNPADVCGGLYAVAQPTINTASSVQTYNLILTSVMGSANSTTTHYGCLLYAYNNNTATVTGLVGAQCWVRNQSTGTITNAIGLRVANPSNSGTITTNYGIYMESMTAGSTDYGIYIAGSDNYAYYAAGGQFYNAGIAGFGATPLSSAQMYVYREVTATTGNYQGLYAKIRAAANASSGVQIYNYLVAEVAGTYAPSAAYGLISEISQTTSVTTSYAICCVAQGQVSAGTITNYYGFYAASPIGSGTVTTKYAFYCDSNWSYGVYVSSGMNYFAGQTGIGASPVSGTYLNLTNSTTVSALRFSGSSDVVSPVGGDVWYDTFDIKLRKGGADHRLDGWVYALVTPVSVTNTTTETTLMSWTVPGGLLAGRRKILVRAFGRITNSSTTATPSLTIRAKYGSSVGTVSFSTVSTSSNRAWQLEFWISSTTSTSSQRASLIFLYGGASSYSSGATATAQTLSDWQSATWVPAVDSSVNQTLAITAQWGAASTSYICEILSAVVHVY